MVTPVKVATKRNSKDDRHHHSSWHPHGGGHHHNGTSRDGLRLRSDSNGSMRSAFYQGTIVSTSETNKTNGNRASLTDGPSHAQSSSLRRRNNKRSSKRSPPKEKQQLSQPTMSHEISMGDVADMAIASLDTPDEMEALLGPPPNSQFLGGGVHAVNGHSLPIYDASDYGGSMGRKSARLVDTTEPLPSDTISSDTDGTDLPSGFGVDAKYAKRDESTAPWGPESQGHARDSTVASDRWDSNRFSLLGTNFLDTVRSGFSFREEGEKKSLFRHLPPIDSETETGVVPNQNASYSSYVANSDYGTSMNSRVPGSGKLPHQEEGSDHKFAGKSYTPQTLLRHLMQLLDPSKWLSSGVMYGEDGVPYFDDRASWTPSGLVRYWIYNPIYPEFTSSQQFSWAVIIGTMMGVYTAGWKLLIEKCVDVVWKDVPETLMEWGVFTELDGKFPLYHYMWIVPAIFGGILSYIFAALPTPIPGQNEWIHNLHSQGVQPSETFGLLFILATAGMASGLALGPELPLILTSGMLGSWLAVLCKQSMLQARVLNLTAAAAAVGGFFGFPMAGALFVLEVPHRTGLQYFEALSPATMASIVAVLTNRILIGNDVTGYYQYPFLNTSLPSEIFTSAIAYGLFGAVLGVFYTKAVLFLKHFVHDLFHKHSNDHHEEKPVENVHSNIDVTIGKLDEKVPLVGGSPAKIDGKEAQPDFGSRLKSLLSCSIPHEPTRAGVAGTLVGAVVGTTAIFIPHVLFWGEAQLQTLIDKGRTPLPVFGHGDDPTADLLAKAYCILGDKDDGVKKGFSLGCSAAITLAKILVTGLSLGSGIIGGHFWGPLFAGCAASHFLTNSLGLLSDRFGILSDLSHYPCVAILCIMGSAHVVTFRAHTAIILILTLTIDAFDPMGDAGGDAKVAGDYSAVFPLLTVAVFVSLQVSRHVVFYEKQRSRADIMALPEVLCEPGKEGKPLVMDYDGHLHELDESDYDYEDTDQEDSSQGLSIVDDGTTEGDIERLFDEKNNQPNRPFQDLSIPSAREPGLSETSSIREGSVGRASPLPPRSHEGRFTRAPSPKNSPTQDHPKNQKRSMHRRTVSAPQKIEQFGKREKSAPKQTNSQKTNEKRGHRRTASGSLVRVDTFGHIHQDRPSLLDQARLRAASSASLDQEHQKEKQRIKPPPNMPTGRRRRTSSDYGESDRGGAPISKDEFDNACAAALKHM